MALSCSFSLKLLLQSSLKASIETINDGEGSSYGKIYIIGKKKSHARFVKKGIRRGDCVGVPQSGQGKRVRKKPEDISFLSNLQGVSVCASGFYVGRLLIRMILVPFHGGWWMVDGVFE